MFAKVEVWPVVLGIISELTFYKKNQTHWKFKNYL